MKIKHSLEAKDYINFNLFQIQHSEPLRKRLYIQRVVVSILFFVIALFAFILLNRFRMIVGVIFLFGSVLWYGYFPTFSKNQVIKSTEKTINRGQLSSLFDEVRLEFDSKGFTEITTQGEHSNSWQDIQSINSTQEYFYLFLTSASAVIIPKRIIGPEELNELEGLIDSHYPGKVEHINT